MPSMWPINDIDWWKPTIRDWLAHFRDAEAAYGCGYVGLLPKTAARGNRTPKAAKESRRLLDEAIEQLYARPKQQKTREVFVIYQRTCLEQHVQPVTERTFYRHVKMVSSPVLTEKRKGARAAYQESTWHWELERCTPRHGDRPWEIAHIDHTQLDIELLSSLGKPLGRPWATFLVDVYSRRLLAVYLTFDPPSYRPNTNVDSVAEWRRKPYLMRSPGLLKDLKRRICKLPGSSSRSYSPSTRALCPELTLC